MEDFTSTSQAVDDSFLNSNQNESVTKTDKSFAKLSSIDKLNKETSKSRDVNASIALQQEVILEEEVDIDVANQQEGQITVNSNQIVPLIDLNEAGIVLENDVHAGVGSQMEPEDEAAEVVEAQQSRKVKRKKFTNENNSSDEEEKPHDSPNFKDELDEAQEAIPTNASVFNSRRLMTAPDFIGRKRLSQRNQTVIGGAYHQPFVERNLMKSTNIYQQFDRKGNLYENRLYAKTSINQAKFNKDQNEYNFKMENQPDEEARINNGTNATEGQKASEISVIQMNKSSVNNTMVGSKSNYDPAKISSMSETQVFAKNRTRVSTDLGINRRGPVVAYQNMQDYRDTFLSGGTINGGTFSKSNAPRLGKIGAYKSQSSLFKQVEMQNTSNNLNSSMNAGARSLSNTQFNNIKKNLGKLKNLHQHNAAWSRRDFDMNLITGGVGGKQNIFEGAQNLCTNEPTMYKQKSYNNTNIEFRPKSEAPAQLYHYYDEADGERIKVHDRKDKKGASGVGRYVNSSNRHFYRKELDNKGNSKVPFSDQDHAAGFNQTNKIQKKAYRSNTQSQQVDGLFKPKKFTQRPSYLNYTRTDFNILRPSQGNYRTAKHMSVSVIEPKKIVESIRAGKCHSIYGICDFKNQNRLSGIKYHEKYQASYTQNNQTFFKQNGDFTIHANNLKTCKF